ncbi:GAF domain-containing protein [Streptomyces alkaliphilus]|uniref:GAF domain-containing protein n=1 Tax=Streptomyces alkaliphilus TaxID=1472722 RepID=A0A7W3TBC0_9ACTN|nr:GAF domain-containing protein [Streptomyces alkaliphilus]MBB0243500.1 GAF domain-containing protein [Streptomyces alkaliphilus]
MDAAHAALHHLELLARGAPAEEHRRADGAVAGSTPEHERARVLALRVRAELEGLRRREAALTALFETARDLAGLRDPDAVLQAIVRRARSLLGTEIAYMTLTDPERGDTYMRVTEGSVSARFQQLRLGMGEGLGGLVAQTARPYVTDDYARDGRFRHTRVIDEGVAEEGLVAILGVPLLLGREVIGVLYAADRRTRVFAREQVALLASFAAHAAVAIDTARLLAGTRAAMAELEAANAVIRERGRAIERAGEVHDRLARIVLRGGGVEDVTAAVGEVLDGEVGYREHVAGEPAPQAPAGGRAVPVVAGEERLGTLVRYPRAGGTEDSGDAGDAGDTAETDLRILERAAMVISLLLLARRTAGEAEQRVRGELLDDLLDAPERAPRLLRERAARIGADLDRPHTVLVARAGSPGGPEDPEGAGRQRLRSAAAHLALTRHGLATSRDGGAVLLLPTEAEEAAEQARRAATQLGAALGGLPVTVGAAGPVPSPATDPAGVAVACAEALRCVETLRSLGRAGEGASAAELGFLGLLLAEHRDIDGFVQRTLGPVLEYDARRNAALTATLEAYFAGGMSALRAKDTLHVHVNTVTQRLDRVGRLLGDDWKSSERTLELQLALRLRRLSGAAVR